MKKVKYILIVISLILSHAMCFIVGYQYMSMLCGIEHLGFSAPANLAFLYAVPFIFGLLVCMAAIDIINRILEDQNSNKKKD